MKRLLRHPTVRRHAPQVMKFIVSGGCGASIDLTTQWMLVDHFGVAPLPGFVLSASSGAVFVFVFNKFITFKSHAEPASRQLMKFAAIYIPAIALNFLLSSTFYWMGAPHKVAKALAIGIGAVINYIMSSSFIFRGKAQEEEEPVVI